MCSVIILICCTLIAEDLSGIFVKSISEGSAADMCKKIQVNDRIVEVYNFESLQVFESEVTQDMLVSYKHVFD